MSVLPYPSPTFFPLTCRAADEPGGRAAGPTAPARAGRRARPGRPAGTHAKTGACPRTHARDHGKVKRPRCPHSLGIRGGRRVAAAAIWPGTAANPGQTGVFPHGIPRREFKRRAGSSWPRNHPLWGFAPIPEPPPGEEGRRGSREGGGEVGVRRAPPPVRRCEGGTCS
jgi:hypothetical protein